MNRLLIFAGLLVPIVSFGILAFSSDIKNQSEYEIILEPFNQDGDLSGFKIKELRAFIIETLIPKASEKERIQLLTKVEILDRALIDEEAFLASPHDFGALLKAYAEIIAISSNYAGVDDFEAYLKMTSSVLMVAHTLSIIQETHSDDLEVEVDFSGDIEKIHSDAVTIAQLGVEKFPAIGSVHGQLAFALTITGGDEQRALKLFRRCIDLDDAADFCKEGYHALMGRQGMK